MIQPMFQQRFENLGHILSLFRHFYVRRISTLRGGADLYRKEEIEEGRYVCRYLSTDAFVSKV